MSKFAIRPRRYRDQLNAIADKIQNYTDAGHVIDTERNPNGKYELLAWAHAEIVRLRANCGEVPKEEA